MKSLFDFLCWCGCVCQNRDGSVAGRPRPICSCRTFWRCWSFFAKISSAFSCHKLIPSKSSLFTIHTERNFFTFSASIILNISSPLFSVIFSNVDQLWQLLLYNICCELESSWAFGSSLGTSPSGIELELRWNC